jgi:hypothetical protein
VALSQLKFLGKYYGGHKVKVRKRAWHTREVAGLRRRSAFLEAESRSAAMHCCELGGNSEKSEGALASIDSYIIEPDPTTLCLRASDGKE